MYLPFNQLSKEAYLWIYQANRLLQHSEEMAVQEKARIFLTSWTSHGRPLQGSVAVRYRQFLILAVEGQYQQATGCAVDASVHFIKMLEQTFAITLLDRTQVAFRVSKENIVVPLSQLREKIQAEAITSDMLTFDNTITTKGELERKWLIPAKDAWFHQYFAPKQRLRRRERSAHEGHFTCINACL